jgi:hypothetical protein
MSGFRQQKVILNIIIRNPVSLVSLLIVACFIFLGTSALLGG